MDGCNDGPLIKLENDLEKCRGLPAHARLTVREGNPGDDAVNDWIAAMMAIYRAITGKEPATSVGPPPS